MKLKTSLTLVDRIALKKRLQEGYTIDNLAKNTSFTAYQITKEVKKGLSKEDGMKKLWGKYDIVRAIENTILENVDKELLDYYLKEKIEEQLNERKEKK